jgi:hypothetical protein
MKQFGGWAEVRKEDDASWKACGLAAVDGVLYMTVSRHWLEDAPGIQQTWDSSIIKSTNGGIMDAEQRAGPGSANVRRPPVQYTFLRALRQGRRGELWTTIFTRFQTMAPGTMATG